jgi:hypothetical protein
MDFASTYASVETRDLPFVPHGLHFTTAQLEEAYVVEQH